MPAHSALSDPPHPSGCSRDFHVRLHRNSTLNAQTAFKDEGAPIRVVAAMRAHVDAGRVTVIYEEAFRDALLAAPAGTFKVEDITGLPWGEIDFPEDLARAHEDVLPMLKESQPVKEKTA